MAKQSTKARHYTDAEKRTAIALGEELGQAAGAAKAGIPKGTMSCWLHKHRKAQERGECWPPIDPGTVSENGEQEVVSEEAEKKVVATVNNGDSRRVARIYTPSERARALERVAAIGVSATSRELGISRYALRDWRKKAERAARGEGESPTSGPSAMDVAEKRDEEILAEYRKHQGLGPSQIQNQLRRRGIKVSVNTVREVMIEKANYRPPKVKRREHTGTVETVRPNQMWHLDFVQQWVNQVSTFTLILIDDYSRFVVGHDVDDAERADLVIQTFMDAVERHGRPESVMHDKGSAFWSWKGMSRFSRLLEEMGIEQIVAQAKEWNGKVEVFNGNLQKELFRVQRFYDVSEMKRRLNTHLSWYNKRRTHHALGGLLVPADRYFGRADEVLARIEAGLPAENTDGYELHQRPLELFKVTSTGGQPEVWLLGQRVL